jgi:hypothetical protein
MCGSSNSAHAEGSGGATRHENANAQRRAHGRRDGSDRQPTDEDCTVNVHHLPTARKSRVPELALDQQPEPALLADVLEELLPGILSRRTAKPYRTVFRGVVWTRRPSRGGLARRCRPTPFKTGCQIERAGAA